MGEPIIIDSSPLSLGNGDSDTDVNSDSDNTDKSDNLTFCANTISSPGSHRTTGIEISESDSEDLPCSMVATFTSTQSNGNEIKYSGESFCGLGENSMSLPDRTVEKFTILVNKGPPVSEVINLVDSGSEESDVDMLPLKEKIKRIFQNNSSESVKSLIRSPKKRLLAHALSSDDDDNYGCTGRKDPSALLSNSIASSMPTTCSSRIDSPNRHKVSTKPSASSLSSLDSICLLKHGHLKSTHTGVEETRTKSEIRELKKLEKEREKILKNVEKEAKKVTKPGESIKLMKINLDKELVEDPVTSDIVNFLAIHNIKHTIVPQVVQGCITWSREVTEHFLHDDLQLQQNKQEIIEDEAVIVLQFAQFLQMVNVFKQKQQGMDYYGSTLLDHLQAVQMLLPEFHLTFIVLGTEKYFRNKKNCKNRQYKAAVRGEQHRLNKQELITKIDMEEAMLDVQLRMKVTFKLIEKIEELGNLLAMYTKAIAEAPYKREHQKQLGLSWYAQADGVGTVKVQKDGLVKLWQQQLMQFHQVTKDTAVAIIAKYPSPLALLQAYKQCASVREAENLLSDIQVRRGVGPLTTNRRVGPELSYKIHTLLTATDGSASLHRK